MWIQLLKPYRFPDENGIPVLYNPGEMLDIKNKDVCQDLIRKGFAADLGEARTYVVPNAGVLVRGKMGNTPLWITALGLSVEMQRKGPWLPFEFTILWNPRYQPNRAELPATFRIMGEYPWDLAAPIKTYDKLVAQLGTDSEQRALEALVHDTRVPYYNSSLLFVRKTAASEELMKVWDKELESATVEEIAFLRAIYQVKPLLLPLPATAVQRG